MSIKWARVEAMQSHFNHFKYGGRGDLITKGSYIWDKQSYSKMYWCYMIPMCGSSVNPVRYGYGILANSISVLQRKLAFS